MQAHIHIRIALCSDAAAVCDLLRRSIVKCCIEDHKNDPAILASWLGNKTADTVSAWFASPVNYPIVAEVDGAIAGIALLTRKGKIALCYTDPDLGYSGVGTALLNTLESQAAAWKLPSIHVASTMTARSFYLQHGYVQKGEEASCFGIQTPVFIKKVSVKPGTHLLPVKCLCSMVTSS
jgi:GNAT superfamily N-acetyltransferase